jgi:WD40 repeat protein
VKPLLTNALATLICLFCFKHFEASQAECKRVSAAIEVDSEYLIEPPVPPTQIVLSTLLKKFPLTLIALIYAYGHPFEGYLENIVFNKYAFSNRGCIVTAADMITPNLLALGFSNGAIQIWNIDLEKCTRIFSPTGKAISAIHHLAHLNKAYIFYADLEIRSWDLIAADQKQHLKQLRAQHPILYFFYGIKPEEKTAKALATEKAKDFLHEQHPGSCPILELPGQRVALAQRAYPDHVDRRTTQLIIGSTQTGKPLLKLGTLPHTITALTLHEGNLAGACTDGAIRIWDIDTGEELFRLPTKEPAKMLIAQDEKLIAIFSCGSFKVFR